MTAATTEPDAYRLNQIADHGGTEDPVPETRIWTAWNAGRDRIFLRDYATGTVGVVLDATGKEIRDAADSLIQAGRSPRLWPDAQNQRVRLLASNG